MPAFKPFRGILPRPDRAYNAILQPNELWDAALHQVVAGPNPDSFHHVLHAANPALSKDGLKRACAAAAANFQSFLRDAWYEEDQEATFYLYHTRYKGIEQTGVIGLCNAHDLLNNHIRKHEHTRNERVDQLYAFLETTGLSTTPVFLTYPPIREVEDLIFQVKQRIPYLQAHSGPATDHKIWRITAAEEVQSLSVHFGQLPAFYIADGHHRAAIAERYVREHPEQGGRMLSILIAANNLTIFPFYRRILNDEGPMDLWGLLDRLKTDYSLKPCMLEQMYYQYLPAQHFLLCTKEASWLLAPKNPKLRGEVLSDLDVSILQNEIISPYLGIADPKADARIEFGPMSLALEGFKALLDKPETSMIFICRAPHAEVIFKVADEGKFMPPKSTSFEPKILSGLVLFKS